MIPKRAILSAPVFAAGSLALAAPGLIRPALASPDGADWEIANSADGCQSCHLGETLEPAPGALEIRGLPETPVPGEAYPLTITVEDPALENAGFLLTVRSEANAPGVLSAAADAALETNGAQARSTWDSSFPSEPGRASWDIIWTAPDVIDAVLKFDLWANAGNDDLSPLGDRPQHRVWELTPSR